MRGSAPFLCSAREFANLPARRMRARLRFRKRRFPSGWDDAGYFPRRRRLEVRMMRLPQVLLGTLALALAAGASAATINLGASVQLSGPLANTGRYYQDGYKFAIDQINKAGGVKVGDTKQQLELKILDNQSDNNLAVRQYVQLVTQDKISLLLGPFASDAVIATSSVAEKYQVPMIQGGGASDQIYSRGYKYIFGTLPAATKYFESTIEAMGKLNPAPKTVALLYADDAFDVSVAKGTRDLIKAAGLTTAL